MKTKLVLLLLLIGACLASIAAAQEGQSPQALCDRAEPAELTMMQFSAAEQVIDPTLDYRAIICTSAGAIYLDLYEKLTPITVNNFVFLAEQGYYDNTSFHRVIPYFMAQGGDPTATGRGGPGYQFGDEAVGFLTFDQPGKLAMANAGPGTNGSQFFITTVPTTYLNFKHTIFGDVLSGQEQVGAIRERDPQTADEPGERLHTVLIITDPALVDSEEATFTQASEEEVSAAFESFTAMLPPALSLVADRSGYFSTADLASVSVAEDLQDSFATFAEAHGHQYRQRMQIANDGCDSSIFFTSLGYWIDVFADADSASAAAQDAFMQQWLDSYDYQRDAADGSYRHSAAACGGEDGVHLLSLATRGRYLVTVDVLVPYSSLAQVSAADILKNLSMQFEGELASIFQGEIR